MNQKQSDENWIQGTICLTLEKHLSKKETYPTLGSTNFKRISLFKILVEGHTDSDGSNEQPNFIWKQSCSSEKPFDWNGIKRID
jgi:hypothetical protein